MLAGEDCYVLVSGSDGVDDVDVRLFASQGEAEQAFFEVLEEALMFSEIENLDDLPAYRERRMFSAPNGDWAEIRTVEIE